MPAAAPTAAPLASWVSLAVTSALASSISSRTTICARSETSWIACAMFGLPPSAACWRAPISSGLIARSVASETPEDDRRHEPAGERGADEDLRAVGRDAERQLARLVVRRAGLARRRRGDDGHGRGRVGGGGRGRAGGGGGG